MNATEFVNKLKAIPFDKMTYLKIGLSEEYVERKIDSFKVNAKGTSNRISGNPILELIENYDLTKLEIGMVTFLSEWYDYDEYIEIGKFEVDVVCISKTSGEVIVISHDDFSIQYYCSQNSEKFLDSLIIAGNFLENCSVNISQYENQSATCKTAELCTDVAGGHKYLNFYKVLLGCFN